MRFLNSSIRVIILLLFVVVASNTVSLAGSPGCPECDYVDPNDEAAYEACVVLQGCAEGTDVPVTGNIWVLALAGFVFAFVKFGGHTKLAGYYYSNMDKQQ